MDDNELAAARPERWKKLAILAVFLGGLGAFFALGGEKYVSFEALKANRDVLLAYVRDHYALMLVATAAVYTASTALSIPGAAVLSLATGFLFGRWVGTAIIAFSATLGATLVFLGARYLFAEAAQRRMGKLARKISAGFQENAFHYLLFLRLVPLFPFWLVNLVPAFTAIKVRTYVIATAVGILPASFIFANLGQSLGRIESLDQLLSFETATALGLLGFLALAPVIVRKLRNL